MSHVLIFRLTSRGKALIILVCTLGLFGIGAHCLEAHMMLGNQGIGAVLHIDPDDDPIARESARFFLEFKDAGDRLDLTACACTVSLRRQGKELFGGEISDGDIFSVGKTTLAFSYIFPDRDLYSLSIEGVPRGDTLFAPFQLNYDIRVARESKGAPKEPTVREFFVRHGVHLYVFIGALILAIIISYFDKGNPKRDTAQNN